MRAEDATRKGKKKEVKAAYLKQLSRHVRVCAIDRLHGSNKTKRGKETKSHVINVH